MWAPAIAASVIPTVAVRNECSATLSGLWMPSSCHPDRGWFLSWPISNRNADLGIRAVDDALASALEVQRRYRALPEVSGD
jgi:hypothetical protein